MEIKLVISFPDGKTEQKELKGEEAERFIGYRIGEKFDGKSVGLSDSLIITGGSDKDGFPMKKGVYGSRREKLLLASGIGYHPKDDGVRKKKRVRGDTITDDIVQINTKVEPKKKKVAKKKAAKPKEAPVEESKAPAEEAVEETPVETTPEEKAPVEEAAEEPAPKEEIEEEASENKEEASE